MYTDIRKKIIIKIIDAAVKNKEAHIPSSLSVLDIIYVLYKDILDIDSILKEQNDRDRFILSKGHAASGLFAILDHFNMLRYSDNSKCKYNSILTVHPIDSIKYIEAATGSLGHGLPIAVGMAMGYKIQNYSHSIYTIIGDGECNEGIIWEAALLASHHKLNNLYCILDYNHSGDNAIKLDSLLEKFKAFNWKCIEIDGHNINSIKSSLTTISNKPIFILANTIKGKGCNIMEKNSMEWHHKYPSEEIYQSILKEL